MTLKSKIRLLIPAAGLGSRLGLHYPKTLLKINHKSILIRLLDSFKNYDQNPAVIIRKEFYELITKHLTFEKKNVELLIQENPTGMGNAILQFKNSRDFNYCQNVILVWGDIPFIDEKTISTTIKCHFDNNNDLTFPTYISQNPYTKVIRNKNGQVIEVVESREHDYVKEIKHEREIGFFIFKKEIVFDLLNKNLTNKFNKVTGEHSFLYIVKHMVDNGYKVEGLNIATFKDTLSINDKNDLEIAIRYLKN